MRRRRWFRPLVALLQLWLVGAISAPGLLPACPMHGGAAFAGATHASAAHADMDSAQMAGMAGDEHARAHHHGHQSHRCCTCPGDCCLATSLAAPAAGMLTASTVATERPRPLPAPVPLRLTPTEHARPPSLGPPALLIG